MNEAQNNARRNYWAEQMDAAYGFMEEMLKYPVRECGEPLVSLETLVEEAGVFVDFARTAIAGKYKRLFYLRKGLAEDFIAIAGDMNKKGWILRVEDAFRSRAMQTELVLQDYVLDVVVRKVIWEKGGELPSPDFLFRRLTALTATSPKIGTHISGSAIDISVLRMDNRTELDRGGPYIELSELTPMASPFVSEEAAATRREITDIMRSHGFMAYPYEFWHYSKGDAYAEFLAKSGAPGKYGPVDFDPASGKITPVVNPEKPLHSYSDIEKNLKLALSRLNL